MSRIFIGTACVIVTTSNGAAGIQPDQDIQFSRVPIEDDPVILANETDANGNPLLYVKTDGCPRAHPQYPLQAIKYTGEEVVDASALETIKSRMNAVFKRTGNGGVIECYFRSGFINSDISLSPASDEDLWAFRVCFVLYKRVMESFAVDLNQEFVYGAEESTMLYRNGCDKLTFSAVDCNLTVLSSIDITYAKRREALYKYNPCVTATELDSVLIGPKMEWHLENFNEYISLHCRVVGTAGGYFAKYTWSPTQASQPYIVHPRTEDDYEKFCQALYNKNTQIQKMKSDKPTTVMQKEPSVYAVIQDEETTLFKLVEGFVQSSPPRMHVWTWPGCGAEDKKKVEFNYSKFNYHLALTDISSPQTSEDRSKMEEMKADIKISKVPGGKWSGIQCLFNNGGIKYWVPVSGRPRGLLTERVDPYSETAGWNLRVCYVLYKRVLAYPGVDLNKTKRSYSVLESPGGAPLVTVSRTGCHTLTMEKQNCKLSVLSSIDIESAKILGLHEGVDPCVSKEELETKMKLPGGVSITSHFIREGHYGWGTLYCGLKGKKGYFAKYTWSGEWRAPEEYSQPEEGFFTGNFERFCEALYRRNELIQLRASYPHPSLL